MHIFLKNSGKVLFTDDDHLNRNSLNRKVLIASLEMSLATRESLWVQFGDGEDFENESVNVLEPIRLAKEGDIYKTLFPKEVLTKPGVWYMTFAVRMYSTNGITFSVNDSYPLEDDGYVSNATVENLWQQIEYSIDLAEQNAFSAKESTKEAKESKTNAANSEENAKNSEYNAEQSAISAKASADNLASMLDRTIKFAPTHEIQDNLKCSWWQQTFSFLKKALSYLLTRVVTAPLKTSEKCIVLAKKIFTINTYRYIIEKT